MKLPITSAAARYVVLLFLLCNFSAALCQKSFRQKTELGLRGNVKRITERSFTVLLNFGKPEKDKPGLENAEYSFLANGEIAEQNIYNQNGSLRARHVYKYNSDGKLIEQAVYNPGGPLKSKFIYLYTDKGLLKEQDLFNPNGTQISKYLYEYNKAGKPTSYKWYNSDGEVGEVTDFNYDSAGNQAAWATFDEAGALMIQASYNYDADGNLLEESLFQSTDSLDKRSVFTYDISTKKLTGIIEMNHQNKPVKSVIYKYDVEGNLISETWFDRDNREQEIFSYKYTYDKRRNWTKRISLRNGVAILITERALEYFK